MTFLYFKNFLSGSETIEKKYNHYKKCFEIDHRDRIVWINEKRQIMLSCPPFFSENNENFVQYKILSVHEDGLFVDNIK
jgi:hypothetical protein